MHSEGILAGELKHGPLALIDAEMPIIMVVVKDHTYEKCLNAVQQVTARSVSFFLILSIQDFYIKIKRRAFFSNSKYNSG